MNGEISGCVALPAILEPKQELGEKLILDLRSERRALYLTAADVNYLFTVIPIAMFGPLIFSRDQSKL